PIAVGNGWVEAAHGKLPVPAPATAILLEGLELAGGSGGPIEGEATTPTGAALVRVLSAGAPPARWRLQQSGWGAGQRNPPHYPNALRLLLAEQAAEAGRVVLLATDVDDMSPEYVEPLRQALVSAGALDVQTWPVQMKKGRSGFRVEVIAPEELAEGVTAALFRHSTPAGVRRWVAERATLPRRQVTVQLAPEVAVRVKVLEQPDAGGVRVKPEYDDVLAAARALGRPPLEIARAVERDAEALVAKSKERVRMIVKPTVAVIGALLVAGVATPAAGQQWQVAKCDLSTKHYLVNSGVLYLRSATETKFADKRTKDLKDADKVLHEALTTGGQEKNPAAWYYLARYYALQNDLAGADTAFARAQALAPACKEDISTWRRVFWVPVFNDGVKAWQAGNTDSATASFRRANAIYGGEPSGFIYLGTLFANANQPDSSAKYFKLAVPAASDPKFSKEKR